MQSALKHIPWMNAIILYVEHTVLFWYYEVPVMYMTAYARSIIMTGQRWPNTQSQLVFGIYQNLFASSIDQQLFIWQKFWGQPASVKKTYTW